MKSMLAFLIALVILGWWWVKSNEESSADVPRATLSNQAEFKGKALEANSLINDRNTQIDAYLDF